MTDYRKLKKAHSLAKNLPHENWRINHGYSKNQKDNWFSLCLEFKDIKGEWSTDLYEFEQIDNLITKIQELISVSVKKQSSIAVH